MGDTTPPSPEPMVLSVGTIEPRKNQLALIKAFKSYKRRNPTSKWRLALVGNLHPIVAEEFLANIGGDIAYHGNVNDAKLLSLYRACAFTVFPSVEEGFGLPILESIALGKPCVCANFGAMSEAAEGGGCYMVDTTDESAICTALAALIDNHALLASLTEEARSRQLDSWFEYGIALRNDIERSARPSNLGHIYYWVNSTATFPKNTGIQRVTRQLARGLISYGLRLIPVKWDHCNNGFQPATALELGHLERWNGPARDAWNPSIAPDACEKGSWFIMRELPLNLANSEQKVLVDFAKQHGMGTAAIFYDAIPWKMRNTYPPAATLAHRDYMAVLGGYDITLPISKFSRRDLIEFLGAHLERPQSLDREIRSVVLPGEFPESPRVEAGSDKPAGDEIVIVSVGTVEPRKNHELLIRSFKIASKMVSRRMRLVIAGASHTFDLDLVARVRGAVADHSCISWEEHVDDAKLRALFGQADFSVYPSVEEGFGLPILESLWYGTPCICANFGAMEEAASGGGCLAVDTRDPIALASAIATLANDSERLEVLRREALYRKVKTWRDYSLEVALHLNELTSRDSAGQIVLSDPEVESRIATMSVPSRPCLSVCISTYNRAEWLALSLKNWANLYPDPMQGVELFVCDNASTDGTPSVVEPYLSRPDFRYQRNTTNVGMLGNLRETAHHARGDYIWILGDDDLLYPGAIDRVIEKVNRNPRVALIYLNYAFTRISDARLIVDFDRFFSEAVPIVPVEADRGGMIREFCARNENFFTGIYTLVFRRDHALNAYSQDTSGRPFSSMLTSIPTTHHVFNSMMEEAGVWIGAPQVVVNMNVSWMQYAPLWILERIPEVYELAERMGANGQEVDRWRRHSLPSVLKYFSEIYVADPMGNLAYFDPARLVRRFKHLPEFAKLESDFITIYKSALEAGHPAAKWAVEEVFSSHRGRPSMAQAGLSSVKYAQATAQA